MNKEKVRSLLRVAAFMCLVDKRSCNDVETIKILDDMREAFYIAIKDLEILEEFEKTQIITGSRFNGRTYAYKCGLNDGKHKRSKDKLLLEVNKAICNNIKALEREDEQ